MTDAVQINKLLCMNLTDSDIGSNTALKYCAAATSVSDVANGGLQLSRLEADPLEH